MPPRISPLVFTKIIFDSPSATAIVTITNITNLPIAFAPVFIYSSSSVYAADKGLFGDLAVVQLSCAVGAAASDTFIYLLAPSEWRTWKEVFGTLVPTAPAGDTMIIMDCIPIPGRTLPTAATGQESGKWDREILPEDASPSTKAAITAKLNQGGMLTEADAATEAWTKAPPFTSGGWQDQLGVDYNGIRTVFGGGADSPAADYITGMFAFGSHLTDKEINDLFAKHWLAVTFDPNTHWVGPGLPGSGVTTLYRKQHALTGTAADWAAADPGALTTFSVFLTTPTWGYQSMTYVFDSSSPGPEWTLSDGRYYRVFAVSESITRAEAQTACVGIGANLATITNATQNQAVLNLLTAAGAAAVAHDDAWIGLYYNTEDAAVVWQDKTKSSWNTTSFPVAADLTVAVDPVAGGWNAQYFGELFFYVASIPMWRDPGPNEDTPPMPNPPKSAAFTWSMVPGETSSYYYPNPDDTGNTPIADRETKAFTDLSVVGWDEGNYHDALKEAIDAWCADSGIVNAGYKQEDPSDAVPERQYVGGTPDVGSRSESPFENIGHIRFMVFGDGVMPNHVYASATTIPEPGANTDNSYNRARALDIRFNSDKTIWASNNSNNENGRYFKKIAMHELGHAFGFAHNTVSDSVMGGGLYTDQPGLGTGDIEGAQAIYGMLATEESQPPSAADICFPAGTPVTTDQGIITIEKLIPGTHTIKEQPIVGITRTKSSDNHLLCFEKHALGHNIPDQQTIMSREHCILYKGKMKRACVFMRYARIRKVKYTGETLYNVVLEKHGSMVVNNMTVETLHPKNKAFGKSFSKKV